MFWFLCATAAFLLLLFKLTRKPNDYFEKRGIKFIKKKSFFATIKGLLCEKRSLLDMAQEFYDPFPEEKITGVFEFGQPTFVVRDPKLLKKLAVKDFDHFTDHKTIITEAMEPMLGKGLFFLKGQKWRDMRATLSPAFTGSKMRQMFEFVSLVGQQVAKALNDKIESSGDDSHDFKELSRKFTVDVIASTAFGIEVNSFSNPGNDFHRISSKLTNLGSTKVMLKIISYLMAPKLMALLKVRLFDKETTEFFGSAIADTMKIREEKGITRNDMISLLMEARKGKLKHNEEEKTVEGFATVQESDVGKTAVTTKFSDEDLTAQCFLFFFAGFDTVSTAMTFMAYELLANPDIQKKLHEEIDEVNESLNGKPLTYEALQNMKYLDQVLSETLRKWPAALLIDRLCLKDCEVDLDDRRFIFEEGKSFFIPVYGIHRDEKYYKNPDKFDPERFNEANRGSIDPDTYLPFGLGPRNCIGSRFALMEIKTMFYFLLQKFDFEVNEKTQIPIKLTKSRLSLEAEPVFLRLKSRK